MKTEETVKEIPAHRPKVANTESKRQRRAKDRAVTRRQLRKLKTAVFVFGLTVSSFAQNAPEKPHRFFDKTNIALFSADALVRTLDAQSTRAFETNPCKCFHEEYLPDSIAKSTPKMYGYSLAVSGALIGVAYLAHRTHHHRIERLIPIADIGYDGRLVVNNWMLTAPLPPVVGKLPNRIEK